jgi:hypothetical protein
MTLDQVDVFGGGRGAGHFLFRIYCLARKSQRPRALKHSEQSRARAQRVERRQIGEIGLENDLDSAAYSRAWGLGSDRGTSHPLTVVRIVERTPVLAFLRNFFTRRFATHRATDSFVNEDSGLAE